MPRNVKNFNKLLANASTKTIRKMRKDVMLALDNAVEAVKPFNLLKRKVKLDTRNETLLIQGLKLRLTRYERIVVIAFGKASIQMTSFVTNLLRDYYVEGITVTPHGTAGFKEINGVAVVEASHPVPDRMSVEAAEKVVELAGTCDERTLVFVLISGGGSALLAMPVEDVSLQDKIKTTEELLKAGASIHEINTIRKHLSAVKGGRLAFYLRKSRTISLIISDVVGDDVSVIASGPTSPDDSTYRDALNILRKYNLVERVPENVVRHLKRGVDGVVPETPKPGDVVFENVSNVVIGGVYDACRAASLHMRRRGYRVIILSTHLVGEAREVGKVISGIAATSCKIGYPTGKPAAFVFGGETTVTVRGNGVGGRNQELALSVAMRIHNLKNVVFASIGTDGVDGPTEAAGALSDSTTLAKARGMGMDAENYLLQNDSNTFFTKLGDVILTGHTGTNVGDVCILAIR